MGLEDYAGPRQLPEGAISRTWPNRWSISRGGLEVLLHTLRRAEPIECKRLARELLQAFTLDEPRS